MFDWVSARVTFWEMPSTTDSEYIGSLVDFTLVKMRLGCRVITFYAFKYDVFQDKKLSS